MKRRLKRPPPTVRFVKVECDAVNSLSPKNLLSSDYVQNE